MNSLQLEQRKMSSFFSISIVHTGGFLLREYPYALRPFCQREVSSTEKKTNRLICASYRSQASRNSAIAISVKDSRA
jgi:hypothetical protein